MRLWSLHPRLLDSKGLVALWREALLARAVLKGKTKGYIHHPQLQRFREHTAPLAAIDTYLYSIWLESQDRGYLFDRAKFGRSRTARLIPITRGQLGYEFKHLKKKIARRAPNHYRELLTIKKIPPHPLFIARPGLIASWEKR